MLHNWSSLYRALRPLISVWILDRRFFADDTWLHIFELRDGATGRILHEDLTIVTIELEQWARLMEKPLASTLKTGVGRWLHFLRSAQDVDPERPPAEFTSEEFREALGIMAAFTKSEARRDLYRRRFEFLATQASIEQEAEERGLAKGLAKGLATAKLEDAKRLKALGVAIDIIVQATGLPREEVEGLSSDGV
jgi:predicted transposase/invertase (TIGR01784 family)